MLNGVLMENSHVGPAIGLDEGDTGVVVALVGHGEPNERGVRLIGLPYERGRM